MKALYVASFFVIGALALPAFADGWHCNSKRGNAKWTAKVFHSIDNTKGRVPSFFLLTNGKEDGLIVRVQKDDERAKKDKRIELGGQAERGTEYTVKLEAEEKDALIKLADKRLDVKAAKAVTLDVNFELNEKGLKDGKTERTGTLTVDDKDGESLHTAKLTCKYDTRQD